LRYVEGLRDIEEVVHVCEPEAGKSLSDDEMGSLEDLIDCQVSREEIPYFQVGKGEKMRLSKSLMNSEVSLDQQEELTEKDQRSLLIIGGIEVFLPHSPVEVRTCVAEATTGEGQPIVTVMEEEENME
jgi:hypothetical protein